jgi:hypothetical protein
VQRNRDVENLLGDAEYAQAADVVSSSAADQLRKRKFQDDRGKAHVMLVKHLVQADLKPQEMDARLLKVPKAKLQKQMHSVSQGLDHFQDSPTSMAGTRAIHQACNVPHNGQCAISPGNILAAADHVFSSVGRLWNRENEC